MISSGLVPRLPHRVAMRAVEVAPTSIEEVSASGSSPATGAHLLPIRVHDPGVLGRDPEGILEAVGQITRRHAPAAAFSSVASNSACAALHMAKASTSAARAARAVPTGQHGGTTGSTVGSPQTAGRPGNPTTLRSAIWPRRPAA